MKCRQKRTRNLMSFRAGGGVGVKTEAMKKNGGKSGVAR